MRRGECEKRVTSVAELMRRVGSSRTLRSALATGVLSSGVMAWSVASLAQEDPKKEAEQKQPEPAPAEPDDAPAHLPPEIREQLRKLREDAKKAGATFTMPGQTGASQATPAAAKPAGAAATAGAKQVPASKAVEGKQSEPAGNNGNEGGKPAMSGSQAAGTEMMPASAAAGDQASHGAASLGAVPPGMVRIEFTDSVDVLLLVQFVRETLGLQLIVQDSGLTGQKVTFTDPIVIARDKLLPFVVEVLESKDYTIVQNTSGIYVVQPRNQIQPAIGSGPFMTTRVIRTPNIRPSQLQTVITNLLAGARGPAAGPASAPTYLDDLGVIIITDTPRVTGLVQSLVNELVNEREDVKYSRFELQHIAATSARDRVLELSGQATQRFAVNIGQPGQPAAAPVAPISTISNLNERLTVDTSSNALIFRGRDDERQMVEHLLSIVDMPNALVSKFYPVGLSTAEAVANAGTKEQLGGIATFESSSGRGVGQGGGRVGASVPAGFGQQGGANDLAGAGFVLYPEAGGFIYRGTAQQHERVVSLIEGLRDLSERDKVVIEFYKLKHGRSEEVAEVVQNLLSNSAPSGNRGGLIGRDLGGANRANRTNQRQPNQPAAGAAAGATGDAPGLGEINGEDVFVIADQGNNQLLVKAPAKLQPQFKQLIQRIDLRRPQVYLDAKIMVVTSVEGLDVTTEVQQIIGQFALNTNFGLGALTSTTGTGDGATTTGGLQSRKVPGTGASGLTTALIRSKDVPFLINALARNVDGRVVATPQLLVDDNSEAEIQSLDQQPTQTTTTSSNGPPVQSFGGFEEAGPSLRIRPQISDGGYLRLEYEIELSSFTGSPSGGLPSPKQTNNIRSESVTVPTDTTIVVGGLVSENQGTTILKIPLLGDIPIIGELFRDTSITKSRTTLFVFITPKIMRDPTFSDLRLITSKPLVALGLPTELPPPEPVRIDILDTAAAQTREREKDAEAENKRREENTPRKKKGRSDTDPWK